MIATPVVYVTALSERQAWVLAESVVWLERMAGARLQEIAYPGGKLVQSEVT